MQIEFQIFNLTAPAIPVKDDLPRNRHTFAVTAIQKGISLPALQRLRGHDHLATTEIYLNLSPEHVLQEHLDKW